MLVLLIAGGLVWSVAGSRAATAQRPRLFGGSLVLEDARPLTIIDVATAQITVRLPGIDQQVAAPAYSDVEAVPVADGTMLVNRLTGTFNFLQQDDYVLDPVGAGVGLGPLARAAGASGYGAGPNTYIVRTAPHSTVSLVSEETVAQAGRLQSAVAGSKRSPIPAVSLLGFAALDGRVSNTAGSVAVAGTDLWVLVSSGAGCLVQQMRSGPHGLTVSTRSTLATPCDRAALERAGGRVGLALPGRVLVFPAAGPPRSVPAPGTRADVSFLPVLGSDRGLWYLARSATGWWVFGVKASGRATAPSALSPLGPEADPVAPVQSGGYLYTLDRAQPGQPTLWVIDPASGHMAPVSGAASYPAFSPTEKANFDGAQVLSDGPRVVFNNPQSLDAVVVFTDGSRSPVVVDKSAAVAISATGPADLNIRPPAKSTGHRSGSRAPAAARPVPVAAQVNQQVACRATTQKPYAPQITAVSPSAQAALVSWSYQLLDQTDCEPDSWSVQMTAVSGSHQPDPPIQTENGQQQYLFVGLRPATTYRAVVTAYINRQSTASPPIAFTTPARGPDAPLAVNTTADGRGGWVVSWRPCTEADNAKCVVPANVWTVTGAACGPTALARPPSVEVPGGQTEVAIDSDQLGLLGDSLTFTVQGALTSGLTGDPTSDHACTEAWRPPIPKDITLSAAGQQEGQTVTAKLVVAVTPSATEALGSRQSEFVFSVGGQTVGPVTSGTVIVPGLAPGQTYTPRVTIYPSGHPTAAVTVTGRPFTRTLSWPAGLALGVTPTVDAADLNAGRLAVSFPGLPSGPMSASGNYVCGSTQGPQVAGPVVDGTLAVSMNLAEFGGSCTLTLAVDDTANPDPYGIPSPSLTASFRIGTPPDYRFSDQISPQCAQSFCLQQQVEVDYAGSGQPTAGDNWALSVTSKGNGPDLCATSENLPQPPQFPHTVTLPVSCPDARSVDVSVSYTYLGTSTTVDAGSPSGTPATTTTTSTTAASTTTVCPPPSTGSSTTRCAATPASQLAAFADPAPAGATARNGAIEWSTAGAAVGCAGLGLRRWRFRSWPTRKPR